jgi:hypothetical protein
MIENCWPPTSASGYMLDGRKFHILSDHKPFTQALLRVSDPWTPRVQRQLSYLAELTSDVRQGQRGPPSLGDGQCTGAPQVSGYILAGRQAKFLSTFSSGVASGVGGCRGHPLASLGSAVVSVKEPAGSLTTAWQRGKPNPSSSTPARQPAALATAVFVAPVTTAEPVS